MQRTKLPVAVGGVDDGGAIAALPATHRSRYHRPRGLRSLRGLYLFGEGELKVLFVVVLLLVLAAVPIPDDVITTVEVPPDEVNLLDLNELSIHYWRIGIVRLIAVIVVGHHELPFLILSPRLLPMVMMIMVMMMIALCFTRRECFLLVTVEMFRFRTAVRPIVAIILLFLNLFHLKQLVVLFLVDFLQLALAREEYCSAVVVVVCCCSSSSSMLSQSWAFAGAGESGALSSAPYDEEEEEEVDVVSGGDSGIIEGGGNGGPREDDFRLFDDEAARISARRFFTILLRIRSLGVRGDLGALLVVVEVSGTFTECSSSTSSSSSVAAALWIVSSLSELSFRRTRMAGSRGFVCDGAEGTVAGSFGPEGSSLVDGGRSSGGFMAVEDEVVSQSSLTKMLRELMESHSLSSLSCVARATELRTGPLEGAEDVGGHGTFSPPAVAAVPRPGVVVNGTVPRLRLPGARIEDGEAEEKAGGLEEGDETSSSSSSCSSSSSSSSASSSLSSPSSCSSLSSSSSSSSSVSACLCNDSSALIAHCCGFCCDNEPSSSSSSSFSSPRCSSGSFLIDSLDNDFLPPVNEEGSMKRDCCRVRVPIFRLFVGQPVRLMRFLRNVPPTLPGPLPGPHAASGDPLSNSCSPITGEPDEMANPEPVPLATIGRSFRSYWTIFFTTDSQRCTSFRLSGGSVPTVCSTSSRSRLLTGSSFRSMAMPSCTTDGGRSSSWSIKSSSSSSVSLLSAVSSIATRSSVTSASPVSERSCFTIAPSVVQPSLLPVTRFSSSDRNASSSWHRVRLFT
uniref:Uncharacterized protein n=1 Tax=Anopheles merus TaxID=30066 RepID=A0A182VKV0_ANOME